MNDETVTGGCLCGAIRYRVSHRIGGVMPCHCRRCQQLSGSAFWAATVYLREHFQLTQGEPTWYASSEICDRGFCGTCGSQLFARYSTPEDSEWISISLGTHDEPNAVPAERHFGVETKQAWLKLDDDLPTREYKDSHIEDLVAGRSETLPELRAALKK